MSRRVLMVAGEASGDALGAELAASLLRADPSIELYGAGGDRMRAAGVRTIIDTAELSVMGFSELGREIFRVLGAHRRLRREISGSRPDLFVPIDFPDFNLPLCRTARRADVRTFYYVSPQVWAWRQGRIDTIARNVDRVLVLFPFEAELYSARGIDARFVGHPLADRIVATKSREEVRASLGVPATKKLVALLPGSRRREIESMLPRMLDALRMLAPDVVPVIAEAASLEPGLVAAVAQRSNDGMAAGSGSPSVAAPVASRRGDTYDLLAAADAALVTSGTATLEAALVGCPMVVAYRMSTFSHALARRLVKVPFIAMPNLLLGRSLVPELVQDDAEPGRMAAELRAILGDDARRAAMSAGFAEIRRLLVRPGAADRAAILALETMAGGARK
jgi:lipid-A-disaccharide synthase